MTKEDFLLVLKEHKEQNELIDKFSELLNFDHPLIDYGFRVFDMLIKTNFNEAQQNWINWWLFDRKPSWSKHINIAYDENGNEIDLDTPEKLWNFVQKYGKGN